MDNAETASVFSRAVAASTSTWRKRYAHHSFNLDLISQQYVISDILSKWEKYEQHGINPEGGSWSLVFKLFSFYDPHATDISKTEQEFLFEQAFESVMLSRFPADDNTHIKLAALRTQFIVGDYEDGAYISDLVKVHPAQSEQLLNPGYAKRLFPALLTVCPVTKVVVL